MKNLFVITFGLLLIANSQAATPVSFTSPPKPPGTLSVINNAPGNQIDPRIHADVVTYSSENGGISEIRYFDFSKLVDPDNAIPGGVSDILPAPFGASSILFVRTVGTQGRLFSFDTAAANPPQELYPALDANRGNPISSNNWVVWEDYSFGPSPTGSEIVVFDNTLGTATRLTNDTLVDLLPAISPDGGLALWVKCTSSLACDIWKALNAGGTWTESAVTSNGHSFSPSTDGVNMVYVTASPIASDLNADIFWQPVAGGTEQQLTLLGEQTNPRISDQLVVFETSYPGSPFLDIQAFDMLNNRLYPITQTTDKTETLGDVVVSPSGQARVVYKVFENGSFNLSAYTFNLNPTANAGLDQSVNEGEPVTLTGTGSGPAGLSTLDYAWTQIGGPNVPLSDPTSIQPTFAAPNVPRGGATLSFDLSITDGQRVSQKSTVNITVKDVNHPPVADAGTPQTVQEDSTAVLDGSASFDPDNDPLSYSWTQKSGPAVTFLNLNTDANPRIKIPLVGNAGAKLIFELAVSDGLATATKSVTINVDHANHPPVANAGPDQTVTEGNPVTLSGLASTDPDSDQLTYTWSQLLGPNVVLNPPNGFMTTFTAPQVGPGGALLDFQLMVDDGLLDSAPDKVNVKVLDSADLPTCKRGRAEPKFLWPPTHNLLPVEIEAVGQRTGYLTGKINDQDDDLRITITQVTQDEPVTSPSDGDMKPDAIIESEEVLLRSERAPKGNGRVYHVGFTAKNKLNKSCTGMVKICVPVNRKSECKDDGPLYNSFGLQ